MAGAFQSDAAHQALFGIPVHNPSSPCDAYSARIAPEDFARSIERARYALKHQSEFEMRQRILGPDGEVRWTQSLGRPRDGDRSRMIGVSFDITERVRKGEALRESEARLKAAVDLGKLGLYFWSPQSNELVWDDATCAMWGLPAQTPMDHQRWLASIHPDDQARVLAAIECCTDFAGDGVYDTEYRVTGTGDGRERWIASRGRMQFEDGKPVGLHGMLIVALGSAVHLETSLAPDLWPALVDPTQIGSIVLNLAINGRDAMEAGGTLSVETANVVIDTDPVRPEGRAVQRSLHDGQMSSPYGNSWSNSTDWGNGGIPARRDP